MLERIQIMLVASLKGFQDHISRGQKENTRMDHLSGEMDAFSEAGLFLY